LNDEITELFFLKMNIFEFLARIEVQNIFFEFLKQATMLWPGKKKPLDLWNVL
jgi:hypothetical protein